jgi:hypothetical protein
MPDPNIPLIKDDKGRNLIALDDLNNILDAVETRYSVYSVSTIEEINEAQKQNWQLLRQLLKQEEPKTK